MLHPSIRVISLSFLCAVATFTACGDDANCEGDTCDPPADACGDGTCDADENSEDCAADCGPPAEECGNGTCDANEDSDSCAADCEPPAEECGNGTCDADEDCSRCEVDCGPCGECTPLDEACSPFNSNCCGESFCHYLNYCHAPCEIGESLPEGNFCEGE